MVSDEQLGIFFKFVYGSESGFACIARIFERDGKKVLYEDWFNYPENLDAMIADVQEHSGSQDVYYSTSLFTEKFRQKAYAKYCAVGWSDLDTCPPDKCLVPPSLEIESSPGRWQALWRFKTPQPPELAEDISRRIAYYHSDDGADKSGWDLTQLLRVPFTTNHKYGLKPQVHVRKTRSEEYEPEDFDKYPEVERYYYETIERGELPDYDPLEKHQGKYPPFVWNLYREPPLKDWSGSLWKLEKLLFEAEFTREEVFKVASKAACNKYERDGRHESLLWKDVCRAWADYDLQQRSITVPKEPNFSPLLTDAEREYIAKHPTIIEEYVEWGKLVTDAAWQYHQAGAFVVLSSLLAGALRLPIGNAHMNMNLWFMILADTTLTRKTTAMKMALKYISDIDDDILLATEGSTEGILEALSTRPGKASLFWRDELAGLLEAMTKKDWMAGMAASFTKLYDGDTEKRILRRGSITVRDPVFVFFGGGIKQRIYQLLNQDSVQSGFLPRFVCITAQSDVEKIRPLGPPTDIGIKQQEALLDKFTKIYRYYNKPNRGIKIGGKTITTDSYWSVELTPEAWARYNQLEQTMTQEAFSSPHSDMLMPSFDRLAKSGLKCAILLSAARQYIMQPKELVVEEQDIIQAIKYVEQWRSYTLEVLYNIGKSVLERTLDTIFTAIVRSGKIHRSLLMRQFHLTKRDADAIFDTLVQRGMVQAEQNGTGTLYSPTKVK